MFGPSDIFKICLFQTYENHSNLQDNCHFLNKKIKVGINGGKYLRGKNGVEKTGLEQT